MSDKPVLPQHMPCEKSPTGKHEITYIKDYFARCQHCGYGTTAGALLIDLQQRIAELEAENNRLEKAWFVLHGRCTKYEEELGLRRPPAPGEGE